MSKKNGNHTWKNRIIGSGEEAPDQLLANPLNFRIHPAAQQAALSGSLDTIGWIQRIIVNKSTGHVIDGHLRVALALRNNEPMVPVEYVELTDAEEAQALLSLDPIAAMAATDRKKLSEIMKQVQSDNEQVQEFIESLSIREGIIEPKFNYDELWQGMPEFEQEDQLGIRIIVHFEKQEDINEFSKLIGQRILPTTKYLWFPEKKPINAIDKVFTNES